MVQISSDLFRTFDFVACLNRVVVSIVIIYKMCLKITDFFTVLICR